MRLRERKRPGHDLNFQAWNDAAEQRGVSARAYNLKTDRHLDRVLAFSGRGE